MADFISAIANSLRDPHQALREAKAVAVAVAIAVAPAVVAAVAAAVALVAVEALAAVVVRQTWTELANVLGDYISAFTKHLFFLFVADVKANHMQLLCKTCRYPFRDASRLSLRCFICGVFSALMATLYLGRIWKTISLCCRRIFGVELYWADKGVDIG